MSSVENVPRAEVRVLGWDSTSICSACAALVHVHPAVVGKLGQRLRPGRSSRARPGTVPGSQALGQERQHRPSSRHLPSRSRRRRAALLLGTERSMMPSGTVSVHRATFTRQGSRLILLIMLGKLMAWGSGGAPPGNKEDGCDGGLSSCGIRSRPDARDAYTATPGRADRYDASSKSPAPRLIRPAPAGPGRHAELPGRCGAGGTRRCACSQEHRGSPPGRLLSPGPPGRRCAARCRSGLSQPKAGPVRVRPVAGASAAQARTG